MLAASDSRLPRIVAHENLPTFQQKPSLKLYGCSMSETDQSCSIFSMRRRHSILTLNT